MGLRGPDYVIALSREFRQKQTVEESVLWDALRSKRLEGLRFRRQHVIGRYIVDFYCAAKHLAVEADGEYHDDNREYDRLRDEYLASCGIMVLRFTNERILADLPGVLEEIAKKARDR